MKGDGALSIPDYQLASYISIDQIKIDEITKRNLRFLFDNYRKHYFDILGSGPIFLGRKIQWHYDFKGNFVFDPKKFNKREKCNHVIGKINGVDIKTVWELGRMYHFPQMAITAVFFPELRKAAVREFKIQTLDFIHQNPCPKTVQWSAVMDTSIRAVNVLVSYDIFRQIDEDEELDIRFSRLIFKWMKTHGKYIINHLEYSGTPSNHYFSNITGVLFISAYLPQTKKTDAWLVFAVQELIKETRRQFNPEGTGREASTSYHRLNAEFLTYSTALVMGILETDRKVAFRKYNPHMVKRLDSVEKQMYVLNSKNFFPTWYWERLFLAAYFTEVITNMKQEIVQIGDNDSGRLLKLSPVGKIIPSKKAIEKYENLAQWNPMRELFFDENELDHTTLLSAVAGLKKDCRGLTYAAKRLPLEHSLIRAIARGYEYPMEVNMLGSLKNIAYYLKGIPALPYQHKKVFSFEYIRKPLTENLEFIHYPRFGICIFKSKVLFLCVVVDTTRYVDLAGHAHNDKLSLDMVVEGKDILKDPGSYVYTSDHAIRNQMRGVASHATIYVNGIEQNRLLSPFNMENKARGHILGKEDNSLTLYAEYGKVKHVRNILIADKSITVSDSCNMPFEANFHVNRFSNGFGKMVKKEF